MTEELSQDIWERVWVLSVCLLMDRLTEKSQMAQLAFLGFAVLLGISAAVFTFQCPPWGGEQEWPLVSGCRRGRCPGGWEPISLPILRYMELASARYDLTILNTSFIFLFCFPCCLYLFLKCHSFFFLVDNYKFMLYFPGKNNSNKTVACFFHVGVDTDVCNETSFD